MTKMHAPRFIVLYAEDDQDDIDLIVDAFSPHKENLEIITVGDGFEALSYLTNLKPLEPSPCLIMLDINMPRMNGKEALQRIRSMDRFRETPVVLFSTSTQPSDKAFATEHNAGFLTKPIMGDQLSSIAERLVNYCSDEVRQKIGRM